VFACDTTNQEWARYGNSTMKFKREFGNQNIKYWA
jgi:hypothetical protein